METDIVSKEDREHAVDWNSRNMTVDLKQLEFGFINFKLG
jgi:hypothetical protein